MQVRLKKLFDRQSLFLSKVITEDLRTDLLDAYQILAVLARVSPCLQPRPNNQLATVRATSPAAVCFSMGCEDRTHLRASSTTSVLVLRTISNPSLRSSMRETRSP